MRFVEGILYVEIAELVECGVSEKYLWKAKSQGVKCWTFINDPADRRRVLIEYESLKEQYKKMIVTRFGDPYEYIAREPIKKMLQPDPKAEQFFMQYRYDENKALSTDHVRKYTKTAAWLNMLNKLNDDKAIIKRDLKLTLDKFWLNVCEMLKTENVDLPTSYQRLRTKMLDYSKNGYASLIDWRFGNKLAAKIGKTESGYDPELEEKQIAIIRAAASKHNNFDAMAITRAVNVVFKQMGWANISHSTVLNIMAKNMHLVAPGRYGKRTYQNTMAMQVKRTRPEYPLQYFTLDGWTVELLFQEDGKYHNRLEMVVVLDVFNNYPIGYAIGDRENAELIRQAMRNAMHHIHDLFGAYYRPWQVQSDNFAISANTPFFESVTNLYTPSAVGNAKSKVIEPYFNYINQTYCKTLKNWSGVNLTSRKENQVNREYLDKIKHEFPDRNGVIKQIDMIMAFERKMKLDQYLQRFEALPEADKVELNKAQMLEVLGQSTGFMNSITGQGLIMSICGTRITYDSFDPVFRSLQHMRFNIRYDENDLSEVLAITEDGKHRFILNQKREIPMDARRLNKEDHQYLKSIRDFNKSREQEIIDTYASDAQHVDEVMGNVRLNLENFNEAAIKLMFTTNGQQKKGIQDAKGLKKIQDATKARTIKESEEDENNWQAIQDAFVKSQISDLDQYLHD